MGDAELEKQAKRVGKAVNTYLKNDSKWTAFIEKTIEPIAKLEEGKLGEDFEKDSDSSSSMNKIFDDEFMRSNDPLLEDENEQE